MIKANYDLQKAEREMYRELREEDQRQQRLREERERQRIEKARRKERLINKLAGIGACAIIIAMFGWIIYINF